ncbi:MAG: methanogenesis marker 2 protein [Candidatus Helarchaeota archaeon]|nr:methanogenesis marker 2 protein [Candidatus Helarchaeota archaeon]
MNLEVIAESIRNFDGVKRKKGIAISIKPLEETLNLGNAKVIKSFGEDAAVFEVPNYDNDYFLLAMDGMWDKLVEADPWLAGYFSILVNVNDIVVKGGTPLALLNIISTTDDSFTREMMDGIVEGCKKFSVPMVGGHYHPRANNNSLSVAILGKVKKTAVLFSDSAEVGDSILMGIDMDGSFNTKFKYAFNTTQHKNPSQINKIFQTWWDITQKGLASAGKDISNPGILGTLGMLLDASEKGGRVNILNIPKPDNIDLDTWLKAYPGYGVIFTSKKENVEEIIRIYSNFSITTKEIGIVDESKKLIIENGTSSVELFDLTKINLSGKSH